MIKSCHQLQNLFKKMKHNLDYTEQHIFTRQQVFLKKTTRKRAYLLKQELTSNVNATYVAMNGFVYTLSLSSRIFQRIHSAGHLVKLRTGRS